MKYKRILVICPYPEKVAPSQRLKFEQYYSSFRKAGYEIEISPFITMSFWKIIYQPGKFFQKAYYTITGYWQRVKDIFRLKEFDIIYVHLWVTPFGLPIFEWLFRKLSHRMIYDIDDLVYLKNVESKAHPLVTIIKGRQKPLYLMKNADHVITCTPYLDEFVRRYNNKTTDISSTVDTMYRYIPENNYNNDHELIIGWSGSLSTSKYLYLLEPVFRQLKTRFQFKLIVMGDPSVKMNGINVKAIEWSEEKELMILKSFDVGVYPLPNEEWVYGKSGLKAIQYMALGIPTVATAIGANFRVIENGVSGYLVNTEKEWVEKLSLLLSDVLLRKQIGMAGRLKVENEFSIHNNLTKYLNVLQSS